MSKVEDADLLKPWELKRRQYKQRARLTGARESDTLAKMRAFAAALGGGGEPTAAASARDGDAGAGPSAAAEQVPHGFLGSGGEADNTSVVVPESPLYSQEPYVLALPTDRLWIGWLRLPELAAPLPAELISVHTPPLYVRCSGGVRGQGAEGHRPRGAEARSLAHRRAAGGCTTPPADTAAPEQMQGCGPPGAKHGQRHTCVATTLPPSPRSLDSCCVALTHLPAHVSLTSASRSQVPAGPV